VSISFHFFSLPFDAVFLSREASHGDAPRSACSPIQPDCLSPSYLVSVVLEPAARQCDRWATPSVPLKIAEESGDNVPACSTVDAGNSANKAHLLNPIKDAVAESAATWAWDAVAAWAWREAWPWG